MKKQYALTLFPHRGCRCAPPRVRPCSVRPPRATGGSPEVARWLPGTVGDRRRWASVDFTKNSYLFPVNEACQAMASA